MSAAPTTKASMQMDSLVSIAKSPQNAVSGQRSLQKKRLKASG